MSELPSNFNWKDSSSHFNLLLAFDKPRDIKQVLDWDWPRQTLGEKTESAVERFLQEGMLVSASLEESLDRLFQVAQLKKLLNDRNLPKSGSKAELIDRLITHDRQGMSKIVEKSVVKCSESAINLIEERKQKIEDVTNLAKQQTFDAFKANDPKDACKIYERCRRDTTESTYRISIYNVEEVQFILTSNPKILSVLSPQNLKSLQLAACMKTLWKTEVPEKWLPETFTSPFKNIEIPINYLIRYAEFQRHLSTIREYSKQVKVNFHSGDIESCNLCLALDGKTFDIDAVPELPMPGCTSETGCMCNLDPIYDYEEEFDDEDQGVVIFSTDLTDENLALGENPVGKLRILKQMLNEDLITQAEYDEKKKEILSRL
jgi:hypothetical protein